MSISPKGDDIFRHTKPYQILEIMNETKRPILYIDLDIVFLRNPSEMIEGLFTPDIDAAFFNNHRPDIFKCSQVVVSGFCHFFNNTTAARHFLTMWLYGMYTLRCFRTLVDDDDALTVLLNNQPLPIPSYEEGMNINLEFLNPYFGIVFDHPEEFTDRPDHLPLSFLGNRSNICNNPEVPYFYLSSAIKSLFAPAIFTRDLMHKHELMKKDYAALSLQARVLKSRQELLTFDAITLEAQQRANKAQQRAAEQRRRQHSNFIFSSPASQ